MRVELATWAGFSLSPPRKLFSTAPYTPIGPVASFDESPDGNSFLFLRETTPTDQNGLIVMQNWVEEMNARARR